MGKSRKDKIYQTFGRYRIPLPRKTGGVHRPKKGKGSYRRRPKHARDLIQQLEFAGQITIPLA